MVDGLVLLLWRLVVILHVLIEAVTSCVLVMTSAKRHCVVSFGGHIVVIVKVFDVSERVRDIQSAGAAVSAVS